MAPNDEERWTGVDAARLGAEPWLVAYADERPEALDAWRAELDARPGYALDRRCVVATDARVVADRLRVGAHTTIASGCVLRGDLSIGANCSLNVGVSTIGRVRLANWVRVATGVVLVGENHVFDDPEQPIAVQGLTSEGVIIDDDVWLGANVTVVDGITVGAHSVVAAGAVVTHDVAPWSVVAGVPARLIRRRAHTGAAPREAANGRPGGRRRVGGLDRFDDIVRAQWPDVLERSHVSAGHVDPGTPTVAGFGTYVDAPGATWNPRPLNDAIEIASAFGATLDAPVDALVELIQSQQDPATGLFLAPGDVPPDPPLRPTHREWDMYGILSCGYALEVLGAAPKYPIAAVESCDPAETQRWLDALDWNWLAWPSGAWIDGFGTAAALNQRHHGSTRRHRALWTWLEGHLHRDTGMWGRHLDDAPDGLGWLMAVNGYYRMTRGTYAQFGRPVLRPERAIDTVLAHARDSDWFDERERNACNVLDVVHPLWLLGQQTSYRRSEVRDGIARVLTSAIADWADGAGFPWATPNTEPGLQGTEMWLSVIFLAADLLGCSDGLSWRPRGVHRLEPIAT